MRISHYVKNLFIFLPLFFAHKFNNFNLLAETSLAFLLFCLCTSGIYILNDIRDIDEDKRHPLKKNRPIAAGQISPALALPWALLLVLASTASAFYFKMSLGLVFSAYVALNMLYTLGLKHIVLIDVTLIATGFVLRLFVGSIGTDIPLTQFIIILTFLLALFLALGKRYTDLKILQVSGQPQNIDGYSLRFLEIAMAVLSAMVLAVYLAFSLAPETTAKFQSDRVYMTTIFVLLGLLRYLQSTFLHNRFGSPTDFFLRDYFIQIILTGWILSFAFIVYG